MSSLARRAIESIHRASMLFKITQNLNMATAMTHTELRRLCDDVTQLGSDVHEDILKHVDPQMLTRNGNGFFFDLADVEPDRLARIKEVVDYAKGTRAKLAEHDRALFESAQRLVAGPIETMSEELAAGASSGAAHGSAAANGGLVLEGEEAFKTAMESGCVSKPAKGVLLKK